MGRTANSGALTESVFYILLRLHHPAHGYVLMKDIAQMTHDRVKLGAGFLYGALDILQKKGWIRALDEHPQDRKIEYIITDMGEQFFEKELLHLEELLRNAEKMKGRTMKMTVKKAFLDIQKEEEWLNEQGENGLMLVGYRSGYYEFENVSPTKFQYKIDLPNYTKNKKRAYLDFLEQTGISVVAEYGGRVYLRRNTADGPLDIYTEKKEVIKQMNKKYSHFFIIGISQFLLAMALLLQTLQYVKQRGIPFWITVVIDVGLIISGIIFFALGILKYRKYAIPKEEKGIWE